MADSGKLTKAEREELTAGILSLGWEVKKTPTDITLASKITGAVIEKIAPPVQDIANVAFLARVRSQIAGMALHDKLDAARDAKLSETNAIIEQFNAEERERAKMADNGQTDSAPSVVGLADQLAEISASGGGLDTTIGEWIANNGAFTYKPKDDSYPARTFAASEYPACKLAQTDNPPFGKLKDGTPNPAADPANWSEAQKLARYYFNVCFAWERKARTALRNAGALDSATPRATGTSAGSATPAKRASAPAPTLTTPRAILATIPAFLDGFTLGDVRFIVQPSASNPAASDAGWGDVVATLGERIASASAPDSAPDNVIAFPGTDRETDSALLAHILAFYGEHPAWQKTAAIVARDTASASARAIPDRVIAGAVEDAKDAERTIYVVIVGTQYETSSAKLERLHARYANVPNAWLVASVGEDGSVTRHPAPIALTVAAPAPAPAPAPDSAPPIIPASLIPPIVVDPASVANVVTSATASGMTASESAKLADSAPALANVA